MKLMVSAAPSLSLSERETTLSTVEHTLRGIMALLDKIERMRFLVRRHDPDGRHHVLYEHARHALAMAREVTSSAGREGCLRQARMYRTLARAEREARAFYPLESAPVSVVRVTTLCTSLPARASNDR